MLKIDKGTLTLSEQTIQEIYKCMLKAKEETSFTNDPMPNNDMNMETYIQLKKERGEIRITSEYAKLDFIIKLNIHGNEQESLGYRLK